MKTIFSMVVFFLLLISLHASDTCKISFAYGNWAPYIGEGLEENGPLGQKIKEAFAAVGCKTTFIHFPWNRAYLMTGELIIDATAPFVANDDRRENFLFSDPIMKSDWVIWHKKGHLDKFQFNNMESLKPYILGANHGFWYMEDFERLGIKTIRFENDTDIFKIIQDNMADLFIQDKLVGENTLRSLPPEMQRSFTHTPPIKSEDLYLLVSKKHPQGQHIIDLFNQGLAAIQSKGQ